MSRAVVEPITGPTIPPTALVGTWQLERVVVDRLAGERRDVRGTATLALEAPRRVRWTEEGTMTWPGHEVPVARTLLVDRVDDAWIVRFADGRLFHRWAVGAPLEHPCSPDHYRGGIAVEGDPVTRWTVEWQASGPEKDYVTTTVHHRLPTP